MSIDPLAKPFEYLSKETELNVLLVHGFTASPTEVEPLGKYLFKKSDKKWNIFSILLPGHGITGDEGYKSLENIKMVDWLTSVEKKIRQIEDAHQAPIILAGLSMGALLICSILGAHHQDTKDFKILGAILLSPAIVVQGILFKLTGLIKMFIKYQKKSPETIKFFETNNLFSYHTRSISAVDELRKLTTHTDKLLSKIKVPCLIVLGESDEVVNIKKTHEKLLKIKKTEIYLKKDFSHIFTVEPKVEEIFLDIFNWIKKLLVNQTN